MNDHSSRGGAQKERATERYVALKTDRVRLGEEGQRGRYNKFRIERLVPLELAGTLSEASANRFGRIVLKILFWPIGFNAGSLIPAPNLRLLADAKSITAIVGFIGHVILLRASQKITL
jgi:hypothetical protein